MSLQSAGEIKTWESMEKKAEHGWAAVPIEKELGGRPGQLEPHGGEDH